MTAQASAQLEADWGGGRTRTYHVQYNPRELSFEKGVQLAEVSIPGLDAPLQQFIRGQAEKLSLELFFDSTAGGLGAGATSVTAETDEIAKLARIDPDSHAPPVVTFRWGASFPGDAVSFAPGVVGDDSTAGSVADAAAGEAWKGKGNQRRNSFIGVAESVRSQFTLFASDGTPLRATVTLVLREYRPLDTQIGQLGLNSPDRTHAHPLAAGETLSQLAYRYYLDPRRWRWISDANGITDPRRLTPGTLLSVPAIDDRTRR
jgi:nucleoid-associated protein YgaU